MSWPELNIATPESVTAARGRQTAVSASATSCRRTLRRRVSRTAAISPAPKVATATTTAKAITAPSGGSRGRQAATKR